MSAPSAVSGGVAVAAAVAVGLVATSISSAVPVRKPADSARHAERKILQIAARSWNHKRLGALIDPTTDLLSNNVHAVCRGQGTRLRAGRYRRFTCVLRAPSHRGRQGLYVSYRPTRNGRARIHWLRFRDR